jgi:drug/metabolite transporter (DMT)-like permease
LLCPVFYFAEYDKEANRKKLTRTLAAGAVCGFILFAAASLQQVGVLLTLSAGKAGFITGLYIVLTPALGIPFGRKTGPALWLGACAACAGLYLLSAPDGLSSVTSGDVALIGCAFFWAGHILYIDRHASGVYPVGFAITQFMVCALLSLACAFIFESPTAPQLFSGRWPLLFSSVFSVGIAYVLQVAGQRKVAPARAALIFSSESFFAALGGALLLGEVLTPRAYMGCAFILIGIFVSQVRGKRVL